MKKPSWTRQPRAVFICAAIACMPLMSMAPATAQAQAQAQAQIQLSSQQLDSLTAPVALYPDALLAQVLMAATFPQDVASAASWSKANPNLKGDDAVKAVASQSWDPSVQSLVAFPQVLATMAAKPDWVAQLGNAFLAQPNDVMDSVQRLRKAAQQAGNLKSSSQQKIVVEQSTIQIQPVNPQMVYVPTYNPTVVYGAWPYPAYPPVYVPPPPGYAFASGLAAGIAFGTGIAITNALWGGFDWNHHDVNINVNHYNNINVNHRIDATSNTTHWNRNTNYTNRNTNVDRNNRSAHDAYRGRDDSRAQAERTLENRTGQNLTGSASQRVNDIHQGGTNRADHMDNMDHADRMDNSNRGGQRTASTGGQSDLHQRAQSVNHDSALRGAGDGEANRRDEARGNASRAAASPRTSPGAATRASAPAGGAGLRDHGGMGGGGSDRHLGRHR